MEIVSEEDKAKLRECLQHDNLLHLKAHAGISSAWDFKQPLTSLHTPALANERVAELRKLGA